nr:hypothetical protein [Tanacetum cinerariifolium]
MSSSSSLSHTTITSTYVSSDTDLPSWGIPLLEACESEPEAPLSVVYASEDTKYLAPSDDDIAPAEDQPLPASPIALSLGYIVDLEPIEEDLEMDPVDYAVDEEEVEPSEDEEERLALVTLHYLYLTLSPQLRRRNLLRLMSLQPHHHHHLDHHTLLFHYLRQVFTRHGRLSDPSHLWQHLLRHSLLTGSESRPPMLNKEKYVPWSSRLLRYTKSRPNGKLIHNSILNGPYVRKMIPELGDANREITVTETFHLQTDDELSDKELNQIEADDQAIQTILLGLPKDMYAAVDSCETAQEIWLRVQQMMKGSDIGIQEKKAKLFNEWERNLKFLNNLQPEWSRHVTIVHQTKDLHTADYTQLYDFLKYNQKEVDELKVEQLAKTQDPLALMANSNNPYAFPAPHQDQSSFNQNDL